ncbi:MAG: phasin family protein [Hyphomonas sp.]|nr:phasin family protein [Hyphomonas sp.]
MAKKNDKKVKAKPAKAAKAKTAKKAAKAKSTVKAAEVVTADMAHKIWLAGVGAYGKAYDKAISNTKTFNKQSTELFEDLVKRGEEIEQEVRARVQDNEVVRGAAKNASKYAVVAREFQTQARDEFEARMERMRDLLGVKGLGKKGGKLAAKLDKLEDEVAETVSKARSKSKDRSNELKQRITRLTEEIEAVATETGADIVKTSKKAALRTSEAVQKAVAKPSKATPPPAAKAKPTAAKAKPVSKPAANAKPAAARAKAAAARSDDFTQITGVGPALAAKLKAAGIKSFADIAALKKADIETLDAKITARGRIVRDNWVKQAKALMK